MGILFKDEALEALFRKGGDSGEIGGEVVSLSVAAGVERKPITFRIWLQRLLNVDPASVDWVVPVDLSDKID